MAKRILITVGDILKEEYAKAKLKMSSYKQFAKAIV